MTKKAQVNLISSPQDLKKIVYTACRTCYSSIIPIEIWKSINYNGEDCCFNDSMVNEKILKLILKVMESGHYSTVEHACFTFTISGISRAAANQLTRHRHMSFSQQSLRYVEIKEDTELLEHIVSNNLKEKAEEIVGKYYVLTYCKEANSKLYWLEIMDFADNLYRYLRKIKNGAEPEDARNILGLGVKTNLVATLNLRELIHLCIWLWSKNLGSNRSCSQNALKMAAVQSWSVVGLIK